MIVWDPELTKTTPLRVWLSTGLRAIDHCVEQYCTLPSPPPQAAKISQDGLRILVSSLLYTKHHPEDLPARMRSQLGGMKSMLPYSRFNIKVGGSHGIGHQLGPHGIPHGETSALTMPSIAKYNAKVNGPQQADILAIFWDDKTVAEVLTKRGLEKDKNDLGDALDAIIRELDLPRTLKEFGVGRDKLQAIAHNSVKDHCCTDNPIPLTEPSQVMEILETFLGD
jgi:alcohol dehydrogenase class IV